MKKKMTSKSATPTKCACGNPKKVSKPTCTLCSFIEYIRGTKDTIPTKVCAYGDSKKTGALCCPACDKALHQYLERRNKNVCFNKTEFLKYMRKDHGIGVAGKCSLCDGNYIFGGNNPQPIIDDYDARCCDRCEEDVVFPARIKRISSGKFAY